MKTSKHTPKPSKAHHTMGRPGSVLAFLLILLLLMSTFQIASAQTSYQDRDEQTVWKSLRKAYFKDRPIADGKDVVSLDAPYRAEDAAVVPITITDQLSSDSDRQISKLWLVIDNNPEPMSAIFTFGPAADRATLATRVRVNSYTYMRVIAETSDKKLYMVKHYVKASGGCSAPVGSDPEKALEHMGQLRLREVRNDNDDGYRTQLQIRHPNITGLQMDQLTRLVYPAHFVDAITVKKGNETVFDSHMTFSLSENPSLQFKVRDNVDGKLSVRVHDNKNNVFTQSWPADKLRPPAVAANEEKTAS